MLSKTNKKLFAIELPDELNRHNTVNFDKFALMWTYDAPCVFIP